MSAHFTTPTDEMLLLAETLGEVKTKTEKLEAEFATQARPLEAATNALSAALSGIKALQFHVLDNNLGALSARVEEMRKAVDEQVGVIALELKKADETNAAKAGQDAEALRSEIAALQAQLGTLGAQFSAQLERVEFSAKEEAKKLQLIPGPAGAAGASLNPRGTFVDGETYNRLDVVSWLGSSYIAAVDGVTEKPSRNSNQWQVLASRGGGAAGGAADFGSLAGVAQINQGGTGQTTRAAGLNALLPDQAGATQYMLLTDGAGNVSWGAQPVAGLPSQTGNSGKLLTTNGTSASWSNAITVSGNNATVGGTLTVSGSGDSTLTGPISWGTTTPANAVLLYKNSNTKYGNGVTSGSLNNFVPSGDNKHSWGYMSNSDGTTYTELVKLTANTGVLAVLGTTASTSTSSGALVVGNGTQGGLGVGGAINAGGALTVNGTGTSTIYGDLVVPGQGKAINAQGYFLFKGAYCNIFSRGTSGGWGTGLVFHSSNTDPSASIVHDPTTGTLTLYTNATASNYSSSDIALQVLTDKQVQVKATTASTGTSSGALVVSGGVGVAGAVYVGGDVVGSSNLVCVATASTNGNVYLRGKGTGFVRVDTGSGFRVEIGKVSFTSLPTSSVGLSAGDIWNDGGTLKIV